MCSTCWRFQYLTDHVHFIQKIHRRPVPLRLEQSPEVVPAYYHAEDDSTALQDAAVKSATSLIAVVNDMLRSPLASARLPPPSSTLAPTHGRPRSRTAPSTPLVELPVQPLVELPGSIPDRPFTPHRESQDGKVRSSTRTSKTAKRSSHSWLHRPVDRKEDIRTGSLSHRTSSEGAERAQPVTPKQYPSGGSTTYKPIRPDITSRRIWSDPIQSHGTLCPVTSTPLCDTTHEHGASKASTSSASTREDSRTSYEASVQSVDMAQVSYASSLQASHEAHLAALTEAHQREIASLNMYIAQLEQHHGIPRTNEPHAHPMMRQHAHLYNNEMYKRVSLWQSTHAQHYDATQQSDPRSQTRDLNDQHCTSSAGCGELWLECNNLRNTLEAANNRLSQSEYDVRRLQSHNRTQKATIEDLQRRLLAANDERLDVREGLHDACCRVRNLVEREAGLVDELEKLRRCSSVTTLAASQQEQDADFTALKAREHMASTETDSLRTKSRSQSLSPSLSSSQTSNSTALGISIPSTPRTSISTDPEELLVATKSPETYVQPQTPLTGVHKDLPGLPPDSSSTPVLLRRGNTVKSVGESIIELYETREGEEWESGWRPNELNDTGRASWGVWV